MNIDFLINVLLQDKPSEEIKNNEQEKVDLFLKYESELIKK